MLVSRATEIGAWHSNGQLGSNLRSTTTKCKSTFITFGHSRSAEPKPMFRNSRTPPVFSRRELLAQVGGGASHVDTWQYKPELERRDGQELEGFDKNTGFFKEQVGPVMRSPFKFARYGESGAWVSEIFPGMAQHVDDMAFIHSCYTNSNNHSPALFMINTGTTRMGDRKSV